MAHRTPALGGIFEGDRDEGHDLFRREGRRRPGSGRVREGVLKGSIQKPFSFPLVHSLYQQGGFHVGQAFGDGRPAVSPEAYRVGLHTKIPSDPFVGMAVRSGEDNPAPTD